MIDLRGRSWRRFGASLSGLALGLQLTLSSLSLAIAASVDPSEAFAGHALCLAGGPRLPAGTPAAPARNHVAFCCLWHQLPGVQPVATAVPIPTAFAPVAAIHAVLAPFTPGPRRGPANARAPPILA
jgi:hypothetical protein